MSAPRFYIEENSDFADLAEIMSADREIKHFVKKRAFRECKFVSTDDLVSYYDKNHINHKDGNSFKLMVMFFAYLLLCH